jgi:hypothetical protein
MLHDTGADGGTIVQIGSLIYVKVAVYSLTRETAVSNKRILKGFGTRCMIFGRGIIIN